MADQTPAPGPCPIEGCGWDADGTLDEHLYEHDYNELRPAVVRLALETDRLRGQLAGVWPCTCSHLPNAHRYDSALGRNFCWNCKPDDDLHNYEAAPTEMEA